MYSSRCGKGFFVGIAIVLTSVTAVAQVGELDHSFLPHGIVHFKGGDSTYGNKQPSIKIYPASTETYAGRIVVAGSWCDYSEPKNGNPSFAVGRFLTDGTPDSSFGTNGVATVAVLSTQQDWCYDLALQSDGKVVLVGRSGNNLGIARLTAAGVPDTSFSDDGLLAYTPAEYSYSWAYSVAVQKDGKIVVGGYGSNGPQSWFLLRLNSDGSVADLQYYDIEPSNNSENFNRLILDDGPSGEQNIYATGSVHDGTRWYVCTLKVDKDLTEVWRVIENPGVNGGGGWGLALHDFDNDSKPEVVVGGEAAEASYNPSALAVVYTDGESSASRYTGFNTTGSYLLSYANGGFISKSVAVNAAGQIYLGGDEQCRSAYVHPAQCGRFGGCLLWRQRTQEVLWVGHG